MILCHKWNNTDENRSSSPINTTKTSNKMTKYTSGSIFTHQGDVILDQIKYSAMLDDYILTLSQKGIIVYVINFHQTRFVVEQNINCFTLRTTGRSFRIYTPDAKKWFVALNYYISTALNLEYPLDTDFRQARLKINQLKPDNCDILLFKNKQFGSQIQRLITQSEYDHVAMFLKSNKNQIFVFECNSEDGVCLFLWDTFLASNYRATIEKIAFRKANFERTLNTMAQLQEFIQNHHGKKYSISVSKLVKKQSIFGQVKENFFCSELIASCFKHLGLIDPNKSACQYWPKDFAAEFPMVNGNLGPETLLI